MTRMALIGLMMTCAFLAMPASIRADDKAEDGSLKVVAHINVAESGIQGVGLKNVTNLLKEAPDTLVEAVCHGAGIGLVEKARTDHSEAVEALIKTEVKFVACENTRRQKSIKKEDLLVGVGTVPSGAVEVIRKQQKDGYADFEP